MASVGSPAEIAATAQAEFRKRRFGLRHPVVTFVLLPLLAPPLLWALATLALLSIGELLEWIGYDGHLVETLPVWLEGWMPVGVYASLVVPSALSAILFCRWGMKIGIAGRWTLLACFMIAVVSAPVFVDVIFPDTERGVLHRCKIRVVDPDPELIHRAKFLIGFGKPHFDGLQLVQIAIPLAIAGCAAWRQWTARQSGLLAS